jgi:transcription termination/antitermination protein NusA
MQTQFTQAITQIAEEKNISKDVIMEAVEAALVAAYKKDYGEKDQEVRVVLREDTGAIEVYVTKEVVDEVENPNMQIAITSAVKVKKGVKVGDTVEILDLPADFGRIAAQTAKQVIVQRIREAERDMVFDEYKDKEGDIINSTVQRIEGDTVICDLGKASGVLFKNEQIPGERYYPNQRFRVFVVRVEQTAKGPQIVLSRSHPGMVKRLFETEVPEIPSGIVEIKAIAREAGGRTKIAVFSKETGVDPVGSCVGQRGMRVQAVMNEIGGEKIDIILFDEDDKVFITNALSPAKVIEITLNEDEKKALVKVPEDQLSLAIGKQGQNVRLAAKLTGWNVDIEGSDTAGVEQIEAIAAKPKKNDKQDLEAAIIAAVEEQNKGTEDKTEEAPSEDSAESKEEAVELAGNSNPSGAQDTAVAAKKTDVKEAPKTEMIESEMDAVNVKKNKEINETAEVEVPVEDAAAKDSADELIEMTKPEAGEKAETEEEAS